MAQSEVTVTPPSPTPPTNMSFVGATGPVPPNFSKTQYAEPFGARNAAGNFTDETPPGVRVNPNPPPYFDDGTAGSLTAFATQAAAPVGGSAATAGGTEGSYPGTGSPPYTNVNNVGAVPTGTSSAPEGAGTEVVATLTYPPAYSGAPVHNPTITVGTGPAQTAATLAAGPNASHASAKAPTVAPTITALTPSSPVGNGGTTPLTVTGTGFRSDSQIYVGGVPQTTNYISATSLSTLNAQKRTSAGTTPITVVTGGTATSATNWTFS